MNIKFNYLYRDAGNYKTFGFIIFSNPKKAGVNALEEMLRKQLIDSAFFDPIKFKVPVLVHTDSKFESTMDHSWNEFESLEETNEEITDYRTIDEFISFIITLNSNQ